MLASKRQDGRQVELALFELIFPQRMNHKV
jgi:hypothetical protein